MKKILFFIGVLLIGKVYALDLTTYSKSAIMIEPTTNTIYFSDDVSCDIGPKYKNNLMEVFNHGNISNNLDSINNGE